MQAPRANEDTTRLLSCLFGHVEGGDAAVMRWLAHAGGNRREPTLSLPIDAQVDRAAVNLHDERLRLALDGFLLALRQVDWLREAGDALAAPIDVLARLGVGLVENKQKRFGPADASLAEARRRAEAAEHPSLIRAADYLWAANRSDMGCPSADLLHVFEATQRAAPGSAPEFLLECVRARHLAKLLYRSGDRDGAMEALINVIDEPLFASLSAIVRGNLLRERGIIHTFCENPAAAREDLREAQRLFASVDYKPGVVRATHSLARSHLFLDVQEAEDDLNRVRAILRDQASVPGGREMRAELADLESRLGDLFFIRGQFDRAEAYYRKDRELTRELGAPARAMAHIDYNLGRVLLARACSADAITHLDQSADAFARVLDPFNELKSRQLLVEALLDARDGERAVAELRTVEALLDRLPDPTDRPKQLADRQVLRALVELRCRRDPDHAWAHLHDALSLLEPYGKDAHFIRVLIALAETHVQKGDPRSAARLLARSARLAEAAGLQDLRLRAERQAAELPSLGDEQRSDLEIACRDGLVEIDAAVLTADMRGYAEVAAEFGVDLVRSLGRLLAEFSSAMAGCAELHDGQLVRFDGDSLIVIFDGQGSRAPKELLAVQAAIQMHQRFRDLRARWKRRGALPIDRLLPDLGMGVGIASGRAIAGHFGITSHRDFAVVGAAVTQAFALQRGSADGQVTVSRKVGSRLAELWPELTLRPVELSPGSGQRVLHAFQIDAALGYPRPRLEASWPGRPSSR